MANAPMAQPNAIQLSTPTTPTNGSTTRSKSSTFVVRLSEYIQWAGDPNAVWIGSTEARAKRPELTARGGGGGPVAAPRCDPTPGSFLG